MAGETAIFIDGGYLANILRDEFALAKVDFGQIAATMVGQEHLYGAYYYYCLPYKSTPPTQEEQQRYDATYRFVSRIGYFTGYTVRLGVLAYRGDNKNNEPIYEQKRVDVALGVDLVHLAITQPIDKACLLTGDSDFISAVEVAQRYGVQVHLYHGDRTTVHDDLWNGVDVRTQIDQTFIDAVRLVDTRSR